MPTDFGSESRAQEEQRELRRQLEEAAQAPVKPPLPTGIDSQRQLSLAGGRKGSKQRSTVASAAAASLASSNAATPVSGLSSSSSSSGGLGSSSSSSRSCRPDSAPPVRNSSFETWRLDFSAGGHGSVRVSEFADMRQLTPSPDADVKREAYTRPANKRDLGHRCNHCRKPFSMLGEELVAELQGGPTQRFHPDCWKQRSNRVPPVMLSSLSLSGQLGGDDASDGGNHTGRTDSQRSSRSSIIASYADEFRRSGMDTERSSYRRGQMRSRSTSARTGVLEGITSVEDAHGEKRVARGFSRQEMEFAEKRWSQASTEGSEEDCAVCLLARQKPLCLPCGHKFCCDCVEPWLRRCGLCPMCRQDLRPHLEHTSSKANLTVRGVARRSGSIPDLASISSRSRGRQGHRRPPLPGTKSARLASTVAM